MFAACSQMQIKYVQVSNGMELAVATQLSILGQASSHLRLSLPHRLSISCLMSMLLYDVLCPKAVPVQPTS